MYRAAARRVLDRIGQKILDDQPDLAPVRLNGEVIDVDVEPHALREQCQLLVFQDLLDQWPEPELGDLQPHAARLPGRERQQVLDHTLQSYAILAQDAGDL